MTDFFGEGYAVVKSLAMTRNAGVYCIVGYGGKIELPTMDVITSEKSIVGNLVGTMAGWRGLPRCSASAMGSCSPDRCGQSLRRQPRRAPRASDVNRSASNP